MSTGCIKEFFEVENYIEDVMKTTNPIGKSNTLNSVIELKVFLLCHSLFLEILTFCYPFQGTEFAKMGFVVFITFSI